MDFVGSVRRPFNLGALGVEETPSETVIIKVVNEDLCKAYFSETFAHRDDLQFPYKGIIIKQGLTNLIAYSEAQKAVCKAKMDFALSQITETPTDSPSDYVFEGVRSKVEFIPLMFTWEQQMKIDGPSRYEKEPISQYGQDEETVQKTCFARQYNDSAREYLGYCVELIYLKALQMSLEDNKDYKLNLRQIASIIPTNSIQKSHPNNDLEKGVTYPEGTIRTQGGVKVQKTGGKWVPVKSEGKKGPVSEQSDLQKKYPAGSKIKVSQFKPTATVTHHEGDQVHYKYKIMGGPTKKGSISGSDLGKINQEPNKKKVDGTKTDSDRMNSDYTPEDQDWGTFNERK